MANKSEKENTEVKAKAKSEPKTKVKKTSSKAEVKTEAPVLAIKPNMDWYVVQAYSGFEQRVADMLKLQIQLQGMEDSFGEVLVPKEKVKEIKDGKIYESERKFFPGYVLVQMIMNEKTWIIVRHTDRVLGFVGENPQTFKKNEHSNWPSPISKKEADKIINRLKETEDSPRPKTMFEVGEVVRVCEGAFKDFTGSVEAVDYEKNRVKVLIAIFGRSTPVELEFGQVEKEK